MWIGLSGPRQGLPADNYEHCNEHLVSIKFGDTLPSRVAISFKTGLYCVGLVGLCDSLFRFVA